MVDTYLIKPAAVLRPYISNYSLREFDTGQAVMSKPMHAVHESYMTLFIKGDNCRLVSVDLKKESVLSNALCGLFTQSQGTTNWQGRFNVLSIQFSGNGFFAIFGIPQNLFINTVTCLEDILGRELFLLTEQLQEAADFTMMTAIIDSYLTKQLMKQKHKAVTGVIANVCEIILKSRGLIQIETLAGMANMSLRNFERRFSEELGMPPKLYARITRFFNAVESKMLKPSCTWQDIISKYDYYDQSHFTKEVKAFTTFPPEVFFSQTPPVLENFKKIN